MAPTVTNSLRMLIVTSKAQNINHNLSIASIIFFLINREVSRTEGISTTDLVGRMLLLTKNHFRQGEKEYAIEKEGLFPTAFINVFQLGYLFQSQLDFWHSNTFLEVFVDKLSFIELFAYFKYFLCSFHFNFHFH